MDAVEGSAAWYICVHRFRPSGRQAQVFGMVEECLVQGKQ
jgi:hypothetical protein